ncbi:hypothetical protein FRB95_006939 [Tulasnella sp. JGI-2019a]|nr:hypothetical protein FRB95_006939 [Tulasnella sp. JGI-2019a]
MSFVAYPTRNLIEDGYIYDPPSLAFATSHHHHSYKKMRVHEVSLSLMLLGQSHWALPTKGIRPERATSSKGRLGNSHRAWFLDHAHVNLKGNSGLESSTRERQEGLVSERMRLTGAT